MKRGLGEKLVPLVIIVAAAVGLLAAFQFDFLGHEGNKLSDDFVYDVSEQAKASSENPLYRELSGAFSTGLTISRAVSVDGNDNIYVAGDSVVRVFESSGTLLRTIQTDSPAYCVTAAQDGHVFVGTDEGVEVFNAQGSQIARWEHALKNGRMTSIAVSGEIVFVADAANRIVVRYDTNGTVVNYIGRKDTQRNIPGFSIPSPYFDLAVASDGLLRAVNPGRHRIEAYTFDGDLELWWGEYSSDLEGFCGCCNPINFALLPDGRFVTVEKGLTRVKIYSVDGEYESLVAGPEQLVPGARHAPCEFPEQCQSSGFDVAVDSKGRVLILDTLQNQVRFFEKKP